MKLKYLFALLAAALPWFILWVSGWNFTRDNSAAACAVISIVAGLMVLAVPLIYELDEEIRK